MIIVFVLTILAILIGVADIKINVESLKIENKNIDFEIIISLYIFKVKLTREKIKRYKIYRNIYEKLKKMDYKEIQKQAKINFNKDLLNHIKDLEIRLKQADLKAFIGVENIILTNMIIVITSMLLSYLFARNVKKFNNEKHKYKILPIYNNKNLVKLDLKCIIKVKLVHIISMMYSLNKKRRVDNNDRTSNRGFDDYSNEQYTRYGRRKYDYRRAN